MAWDKNDLIAAGLIIFLAALGILIAAALLGVLPSIDTVFNFQPGEITQAALISPDGKNQILQLGRPETHSLSL